MGLLRDDIDIDHIYPYAGLMSKTARFRRYQQAYAHIWEVVLSEKSAVYRVKNGYQDFTEWAFAPAPLIELLDTRALEEAFDGEIEISLDESVELSQNYVSDDLLARFNDYPGTIWADDHDYD